MTHLFIVNPAAGKRRSQRRLMERIRTLPFPAEVRVTEGAGHGRRLAREAAESGRPVRIYACGGDGTLNEVVQGAAGFSSAAVTHVPLGTGNDFLKLFGPRARERFQDLEELSRGPEAEFDLIDCSGSLGLNVVCAGVDARIAADVHRYKALPLVSGIGAYILSLVVNVLFKPLSQPVRVDMGDIHFQGEATLLCVCSGRYYGGGFMPVAEAMPDDGVLDALLVPRVSRFTFFRLVGKYAAGRYREYPRLISHYHGDRISVSSPAELTAVVDGEAGRARSFQISLSPKKVRFFYPAGMDYKPHL